MNAIDTVSQYVREAIEELHHVRWPTQKQAIRLSAVVVGFTLVSAGAFGAIDFVLSIIVNSLIATV
jgi:preprotein translocase SecE subunit